jgi:hypothetical protein
VYLNAYVRFKLPMNVFFFRLKQVISSLCLNGLTKKKHHKRRINLTYDQLLATCTQLEVVKLKIADSSFKFFFF